MKTQNVDSKISFASVLLLLSKLQGASVAKWSMKIIISKQTLSTMRLWVQTALEHLTTILIEEDYHFVYPRSVVLFGHA